MTLVLFWIGLLGLFALFTRVGRLLGLIPIVSQLLLASFGLPLVMLWLAAPVGLDNAQVLAAPWLKPLYGVAFTLLLGHILSDVIDLRLEAASVKIALPSFFVPFFCGLACATWLLPSASLLSNVAVGLLFALTAIPVLFLYLRHLGYPEPTIRRLLQAAILMDLMCWCLFGLAQGSAAPTTLLWPLLAALLPLALYLVRVRAPLVYSLAFFALLLTLQQLKLNALVFGIAYLLVMAALRVPFRLPLPVAVFHALQVWLAVPLILAYGLLQIDWHTAWQGYSWVQFSALLVLPVLSKLAGNWLGLSWAEGRLAASPAKWRQSVLLNTRGLTEIVFLNLLFQQQIISAQLYFALMLMGLIATLLPALTQRARAVPSTVSERSPHEVH
ncbi:sodium:proton antiporter [Metapseudomonas otitidis]|uniref:sodium:proton antiporter n=1 Tax=Metapseudomonas otitidis TaxID=319939 RepID=UPI001F38CAF4|nr:sodium:proton antiporter [Pseudomonas otitidis]